MKGLRATILDCGYTMLDSNFMISLDTYMTAANPDAPRKWYKCPTYCVLFCHPTAGNILFDLGTRVDTKDYAPESISGTDIYYGTPENDIVHQLALAGFKPEDIDHVIVSHMHYDHIDNLYYFKDTADFYVSRAEFQYAACTVSQSLDPVDHGFYIREEVLTPFKKLHLIDEDTMLWPGMRVIMLPGHTPGVMGLVAELESGTRILPSDAIYSAKNYEGTPPGIIEDTLGFQRSLTKVKSLVEKYQAEVWFSHDGEQFEQMKKAPYFY